MVRQGDIIKINFNPQSGHEQSGSRPAVVISNNYFIEKAKLAIVCPITNTDKNFPLHVKLDDRIKTTGVVLCELLTLKAGHINLLKRCQKIFWKMLSLEYLQKLNYNSKKTLLHGASFSDLLLS